MSFVTTFGVKLVLGDGAGPQAILSHNREMELRLV